MVAVAPLTVRQETAGIIDELVDLNAAIAQAVRDSAPSDVPSDASGDSARPTGIAAATASREGADNHSRHADLYAIEGGNAA